MGEEEVWYHNLNISLDILGRCDQWINPPSVQDAQTFFADESPYGYSFGSDANWMALVSIWLVSAEIVSGKSPCPDPKYDRLCLGF